MTREEIFQKHEITQFVTDRGAELKQAGSQLITNICPLVGEHKSGHNCVNIDEQLQVWFCNDCGKGGSVIDWIMYEKKIKDVDAIKLLSGEVGDANATVGPQQTTRTATNAGPNVQPAGPAKEVARYNYTNENGQLLYQVVRFEPGRNGGKKDFVQRQPKGSDWKYDLEGVTRVLYNLPKVLLASQVCVTEGEKDADNLNALGYTATTNAGGSKNWLPAYAEHLKGKEVIVFEDSDTAGKLHADKVIESVRDVASSVRRIRFEGHKDVTDWIEENNSCGTMITKGLLDEIINKTPHVVAPLPIYNIWQMEERYSDYVNDPRNRGFSMSKFSSEFSKINNSLMPGEVVMIVGDTSQGKTAFLQAIARSASPLPVLMFELELPLESMFSRSVQMERKCYESDIIAGYKQNPKGRYADTFKSLQHIYVCPEAGLNIEQVEKFVVKSDLVIGDRPGIVMIDYMGLVGSSGYGKTGYESMAYNANQSKVMAKRCNTIVFIGSQVGRPQGKEHVQDVKIHHAKGAGELENSSNLVLGISRPEDKLLKMKVLKNTRGPVGAELEFDFDPGKLQITERPSCYA